MTMNGFVSYAHEDYRLFRGFRPHLAAIRRSFAMPIWTDHQITAGTQWDARIAAAIQSADIFVLAITPHFIESDYIQETEIPAIRNRRSDGALVLPIVLQQCLWQYVASSLHAAPTENGRVRPVTDWHPRNDGYHRACEQMIAAIERHFGITRGHIGWGSA